jgi:acetoacetyl-CoA synthetase
MEIKAPHHQIIPKPDMKAIPPILWKPSTEAIQQSNLKKYQVFLANDPRYGLHFDDYQGIWEWSAAEPARFWESLVHYFQLEWQYEEVLSGEMPQARWFDGAHLNYAEQIFARQTGQNPMLIFQSERQSLQNFDKNTIARQVASLQQHLRSLGVKKGDRIVGYLPNCPQATVAFLACASLGAIWSCCSPDFGVKSVLERFQQIQPKVLIGVNAYLYGGKSFDRNAELLALKAGLQELVALIQVPYLPEMPLQADFAKWEDIVNSTVHTPLVFEGVEFSHPLWILYSSGTTGLPKPITHSHGGMLLEHLKYLTFHNDVKPGERFFWYSTTGWMMWNFVQASMLAGATAVLYDGSPGFPHMNSLWEMAKNAGVHHFGTSAAFVLACMKAEFSPVNLDLQDLRSIGITGSPLPPEGFRWLTEKVKPGVWTCSMSGGTDVCTAFVGGNPWEPVYEGEIQCRTLGCAMESWDEKGQAIINGVGEMVITQPMPCMPIKFWNDPGFQRYRSSYFEEFPGVWRHGDWLEITDRGSLRILGRSDSTLNRQGIRIGTAEIYRTVEKIIEVQDSLIVNLEKEGGDSIMPLFVVLPIGQTLDQELIAKIKTALKQECSPRHVPDVICQVPAIPYTLSGKKMEIAVKKKLLGLPLDQSVNKDAMRNPEALDAFEV